MSDTNQQYSRQNEKSDLEIILGPKQSLHPFRRQPPNIQLFFELFYLRIG